ncbi:hypothetical protein HPP92_028536 [Vanilla planifolia]|uniref:Uncharacterized protein n=1 Tax=Vanilla planifolia TaxID=51239 RepID=A0A835P753_VANPL|nr:hypothetical protein HPP92_028536 [Vanilla planifolia]
MAVKDKYDPSCDYMSEGAIDREHDFSALECHEGKDGLSHSQMQDDGQYTDAILIGPIAAKETLVCFQVASDTKMVEVDFSNQEKCETNGIKINVEAHTDKIVSPVIDGNAGVVCSIDSSGPCAQGKRISEMLHAKDELITHTDSFSDHSAQWPPDHVEVGAHNNLSTGAKTHVSLSSDVELSITMPQSPACQMHQYNEEAFRVSTNGSKSKSMACEGCVSDESICSGELNSGADANQSKCPHLNPQKNSDDDQFPCRTAFIIKQETNSPDMKVDDSKCSILSDGSLDAEKSVSPLHICPDLTCSDSEGVQQCIKGMPSMVDSLSSKGVGGTFVDSHLRSPGQVSLDDYFCSEYHSDASPVDADPITGLEMVEFLGDNHSQYEDGELRESICNSWGEDGAEEVDAEHVDYGSDYRETEFFEAEPTSRLQTDLTFGNLECKQEEPFLPSHIDEKLLPFPEGDLHSKHVLKCLPMPSVSDVGSGKAIGVDMLQTLRKNVDALNISETFSKGKKRLLAPEVAVDVGDVSGKSSQPASSRLKSSGWDKLPGVDDSGATFLQNHGYTSSLPSA